MKANAFASCSRQAKMQNGAPAHVAVRIWRLPVGSDCSAGCRCYTKLHFTVPSRLGPKEGSLLSQVETRVPFEGLIGSGPSRSKNLGLAPNELGPIRLSG